jgi:SAM-dependent methyltransferase
VERRNWDERYSAPDRNPLGEPNALVVDELGATPPGRALDLAAGEGRHARWLASLGWQVVAVDFSEVGLRRAKQLADDAGAHVHFVVADVHTLPLPPARFELVLATFFHPRPGERPALYRKMAGRWPPAAPCSSSPTTRPTRARSTPTS